MDVRFFKYKNRRADFKRLLRLWNRVTLSISKASILKNDAYRGLWNRVTLSISKAMHPIMLMRRRLWNRVTLSISKAQHCKRCYSG